MTQSPHPPAGELSTETGNQRPAPSLWRGWALALFATLCFSVAAPVAGGAIGSGLNPTAILVVRMALTTALLVITIGVTDRTLLWAGWRGAIIAFATGLVNSLGMIGYFWALARMDVSIAAMIFSVSPLFTLSVLALRGEPVTRRHLVRMALAMGGIYFLIGPGGAVDGVGLLLMSLSVVSFGLQVVFIQWYLRGYDARTVTLYMTVGMALGVTLFWLAQGTPWVTPGINGWLAIVALAVVSTYLARLAFFGAIGRIGGAQVAMLTPLEILLTVLWSLLFLGERLTTMQWLGGVLILTSALLAIERLGRARLPLRWRLWGKV